MTRILTFTPVWRRPEIFEICLTGLKRLQSYRPDKFQIRPFFIVSESQAAQQVERYGFDFIYWENKPLGAKKNAGLKYAMQNFEFDYLMELGSDDLIANKWLDIIEPYCLKSVPQITPDSVWFIDVNTKETTYWKTDKILGLGRCISRKALAEFAPNYNLWTPERNRGLDTCSWINLASVGIDNLLIEMDDIYTIDLKSEVNINSIIPYIEVKVAMNRLFRHLPEQGMVQQLIKRRSGNTGYKEEAIKKRQKIMEERSEERLLISFLKKVVV